MNWTLREATEADAGRIVTFMDKMAQEPDLRVILRTGQSVLDEKIFIQHYADQENSVIFIAEHEDEVIGYVRVTGSLSPYAVHVVEVGGVAVLKGYRSQGIGAALMQAVLDWAASSPLIQRVQLEVSTDNKRAIQFYRKLGFQLEGVRKHSYLVNGVFYDSLLMAKMVTQVVAHHKPNYMMDISRRLVNALATS